MSAAVLWFRRDLRLADHPALLAAADEGPVVALFVLDDVLRKPSGAPRVAFMYRTLRDLDAKLRQHGGGLVVRRGQPENVVPAVAREAGASSVHISADFGPYGKARDERVEAALGDVAAGPHRLAVRGRPGPGDQGRRHAVQGLHARSTGPGPSMAGASPPDRTPGDVEWRTLDGTGIPQDPDAARRADPAGRGRGRGAGRLAAGSGAAACAATTPSGTGPTWTAPRACRPT